MTPADRVRSFDQAESAGVFLSVALSVQRASSACSKTRMTFSEAMHHAFALIHLRAVEGAPLQ